MNRSTKRGVVSLESELKTLFLALLNPRNESSFFISYVTPTYLIVAREKQTGTVGGHAVAGGTWTKAESA